MVVDLQRKMVQLDLIFNFSAKLGVGNSLIVVVF